MSKVKGLLIALLIAVLGALSYVAALPAGPAEADNRLSNFGHWDRTGSVAHVKFLDHTGDPWPVGTSHLDWDEADNIDVDWQLDENSTGCGADCVRVRTADESDPFFGPTCSGIVGYWTNGAPDANNHWTAPEGVWFNRACNNRSAAFRRALTCQELGHALGLDHAGTTASCMFQDPSEAATTPRDHDINAMLDDRIYDH
jgi:hypothetical protein